MGRINTARLIAVIVAIAFTIASPAASAQPLPADVKSLIAFVYASPPITSSNNSWRPSGTAFFAGVKLPNSELVTPYVVTAKHIVAPNDQLLSRIVLRLNRTTGGPYFSPITLVPGRTVFFHPDPSVDIAVMAPPRDFDQYDVKVLRDDAIPSKEDVEKLKISEGSEVFFTGMFTPHLGTAKNYPIVRFGRVALMSDEKIMFINKLRDLYLVESASYGGNSGSPVLFLLGTNRTLGSITTGWEMRLAGVMSGTFLDTQEVGEAELNRRALVSRANMGIAAVTPAYKLREILFGQELKTLRGW